MTQQPQSPISPTLSLDLRLRFLETLLSGTPSRPLPSTPPSIARHVDLVQSQLKAVLETSAGGEAVRRFVQSYDLNAPLLRLPPVSSSSEADDDLSPHSRACLILESEPSIRQLERELREVALLDERGVVGAGQLDECEGLRGALSGVEEGVGPLVKGYGELEERSMELLGRYNAYIETLSEIFISWNGILEEAEERVTRLEKERGRGEDFE